MTPPHTGHTPGRWPRTPPLSVAAKASRSAVAPRPTAHCSVSTKKLFSTFAEPCAPAFSRSKLVVFSHLRWDFVFQRPQHLLSRLARHASACCSSRSRCTTPGEARLEAIQADASRRACCDRTPRRRRRAFTTTSSPSSSRSSRRHLEAGGIDDYAVWFYTPMALPLMADLDPRVVVYDCMDELSRLQGRSAPAVQREAALLRRADLVLHRRAEPLRSEARRQPPRALPAERRRQRPISPASALAETPLVERAAALQAGIDSPRLGYYGVIDERLDLAAGRRAGRRRPVWQIVMVGPVVKIDPAGLPQRPNLHWLGQQRMSCCRRSWPAGGGPHAVRAATVRPGTSARPRPWNTWPGARW